MTADQPRAHSSAEPEPLLAVRDLRVSFRTPLGTANVLRGVSLTVRHGTILGLVGETGSGKTMLGRTIFRLLPNNADVSGEVRFEGTNLLGLSEGSMRSIRGRRMAMIFQDPSTALNPVFTIGAQMTRVLALQERMTKVEARRRSAELLAEVGLPEPVAMLQHYPHQLSGGMQQRVMIAVALSMNPALLVADEPTTALDVTVQAQILDLLLSLCQTRRLSVLFISHNLGVVEQICNDVTVLYAGEVMESGEVGAVVRHPRHPYTAGLLGALPRSRERRQPLQVIPGSVTSVMTDVDGCPFAPRCSFVMDKCWHDRPDGLTAEDGRMVACWLEADDASLAEGADAR
jgi:oligopeptide/dipeptide ABC transporter ATP-binding protein